MKNNGKPKPENDKVAWNRAVNEEPFVYIPWEEANRRGLRHILSLAIRATEALKLDFGGVDVIDRDGKGYVLEVNTAPTLNSSPYVAKRWGMYFDWLFKSEKRKDHWDGYYLREQANSMIWKNFQLLGHEKEDVQF